MAEKEWGLVLWNKVEKTDKSITKEIGQGSFKLTAIDAYHQFKNATEQFGPFGLGWGTEDDSYEEVSAGLLLYKARFWYNFQDIRGDFPIASAIMMYKSYTKDGKKVETLNSDCFKSVRTDALTKALSLLGFNADVFMGVFDGNKYVADKKKPTKDAPKESSGDWDGTEEIKFGKFKGQTYADMEDDYLIWVIEKSSLAKYTKDDCQKELDRRQQPDSPNTMASDDADMTDNEMEILTKLFEANYDDAFWVDFKETHPDKLTFGLYKKFKSLLDGAAEFGIEAGEIGNKLDEITRGLK